MPDLKSELFKVIPHMKANPKDQSLDNLAFDDDDTPPPTTATPVKLTADSLYAYVCAHPGCNYTDLLAAFPDSQRQMGARLRQMTDAGWLDRTLKDNLWHYRKGTVERRKLTTEDRVALMNKARLAIGTKTKKKAKTITLVKTKRTVAKATKPASPANTMPDADTIIDSLGLKQAKALYEELKKYFG